MKDHAETCAATRAGTVEVRPVAVTAWRRGCCPIRQSVLDLDRLIDDFDFDPAALDADTAVHFRALTGLARRRRATVGFAFRGRDGAIHWIAVDTGTTALEVRPLTTPRRAGGEGFGLDGDETGTFFPEAGDPVAFGGEGQPRLSLILAGHYVPPGGTGPLSPLGSYQVDGDDCPPVVRNPMHDGGAPGLPGDRCGLAACLPPWASVVTSYGMKPAARLCGGEVLRTEADGWQPLRWVRVPRPEAARQPVYLATAAGVPVSPDSAVGRILLVSGRISCVSGGG